MDESTHHRVFFEEKEATVQVELSGDAGHEDHCTARDEALRMCADKNTTRLLVDLRDLNTVRSNVTQCFAFGESLASGAQGIRLALVLPANADSKMDVEYTTSVATNQGATTRNFETVEAASKWLLEKG
jgi:hypothetical protein